MTAVARPASLPQKKQRLCLWLGRMHPQGRSKSVTMAYFNPAHFNWRARGLSQGPTFARMMTKTMLAQEWSMSAEAQAQAICMQTQDFHRAYHAFVAKEKPQFAGD